MKKEETMGDVYSYVARPWGKEIILFVGRMEQFNGYLKNQWNQPPQYKGEGVHAFMFGFRAEGHGRVYTVYLPAYSGSPSDGATLSHELLHVATHLLDECGVDYSDESKEVLNYVFSDLHEEFLRRLRTAPDAGKASPAVPASRIGSASLSRMLEWANETSNAVEEAHKSAGNLAKKASECGDPELARVAMQLDNAIMELYDMPLIDLGDVIRIRTKETDRKMLSLGAVEYLEHLDAIEEAINEEQKD